MRTMFSALALLLAPAALAAQGWIEPGPIRVGQAVTKVRTAVHVTVDGRIAQVEVEEWFRNDGGILGEGDYIYPLPGEAVFSNFSLFQGDEELRGETMNAQEARRIYEEIVRRRRDPALIEMVGHGMVRARVFPINPGETRKITLRYTQVMRRSGDALQFRYVAGAARRERPVVDGRPAPQAVSHAPLRFTLEVEDGAAFRDPFSPTHRVRIDREDGRLRVRPEGDLEGNFALFLPLARGLVGMTIATHRPSAEPGYFMLTLSPGNADAAAQPRDLQVVVDVSGSMSGTKLEQAKSALRQLLGSLGSRDRFRLIAFSNRVVTHSPRLVRVNEESLAEARRWIDRLAANGGTNIDGALEEAFRVESSADRLPLVVFMTDGIPSVGEQNPERIAEHAESQRGRRRVFAFGVGYDVNTYLLDRLSAAGRGTTEYVEPSEDVEQAVSALATKIQHPVLTDLELGDAPARLTEIYPVQLPDLFSGEELVIFGRYEGTGSGGITLRGRRAGRAERFTTDADFAEHSLDNDFIPRLWASRKIGHLARQIRIEGQSEHLVNEIRETALRYGLLSEYTSYLVMEPNMVAFRDQTGAVNRQMSAPTARPPAEARGRGAVQMAEADRARREVSSAADIDAFEAEAARSDDAGTRMVAGRWFRLDADTWTDITHRNELPVVDIELYSDTYFALLQQLPELEQWLVELESVLVAGAEVSIRIVSDAAPAVEGAEMGRLVRRFRGH